MSVIGTLVGQKIHQDVSDWLYGDWDEEKFRIFQIAYAVPGVHDYLDYLLDSHADEEYLARYGMDYSDIRDPRKLRSTRSYGSTLNFVSSNVKRLYR